MIKLKIKKQIKLLNYQQFLKTIWLKKKPRQLNKILFENKILFNNLNLESYVIDFNNYENIYLPFTLIKISEISTIALTYKNILLFNYDLTYQILYQFNKIMFQHLLIKKNIIKGRLLGKNWNNKKIFISILGFVFSIKPTNLNNYLKYNKKTKFIKKNNTKIFYKKKINSTRLINSYKLKYLNFIIIKCDKNILKKKYISRIIYLQKIIKNKKIKNNIFKNNKQN